LSAAVSLGERPRTHRRDLDRAALLEQFGSVTPGDLADFGKVLVDEALP